MVARRLIASLLALALPAQPLLAQAVDAQAAAAPNPAVYKPQDKDERGLWMQMDEAERGLKASALVIRDPELNAYVRGVLCKTVGADRCANVRLYIVRTPHFNASMALNGVMQVYSGLLLRTQNEAQLAAVLGHEYAHFENRHSLKMFRDIKAKSNSATWLAFTGIGLLASFGLAASLYAYSREMEREADSGGLKFMAAAGYDTREAANVWEQLRAEMDATASARNVKSKKDKDRGLFGTHPPTAERVAALKEQAIAEPGVAGATGAEAFRVAMGRWWPDFVEDQFKLNDFGASDYLLQAMAAQGWSPWLLYARGELYRRRAIGGDLVEALSFYDQGIASGGDLPQLWRGRGLANLKLGNEAAGKADLKEYMRRAPDAADRTMMAMMAGEQQ